jgi:hypothetical protein
MSTQSWTLSAPVLSWSPAWNGKCPPGRLGGGSYPGALPRTRASHAVKGTGFPGAVEAGPLAVARVLQPRRRRPASAEAVPGGG